MNEFRPEASNFLFEQLSSEVVWSSEKLELFF